MGQISSFPTPHKPLIDFACLPKEAIQSLWLSYNLLGEGWSVNLDQFCALFKGAAYLRDNYKYTDDQLRSLFKTFDTDANGLIDVLEMVITLALVSGMDLVEKVQFAFSVYDMSSKGLLLHDETHLLFRSTAKGLSKISTCEGFSTAGAYDGETFSSLLFASASKSTMWDKIDCEQFTEYVLSNPVLRNWLNAASNLNLPNANASLGLIDVSDRQRWGTAHELSLQSAARSVSHAVNQEVQQSEIEAVKEDVVVLDSPSQTFPQPNGALGATLRVPDDNNNEEQNQENASLNTSIVDTASLTGWRAQLDRLRPEELPPVRDDVPEDVIESQWIGGINAKRGENWMQRSARYRSENSDAIVYTSAAHVLTAKKNEESGQWTQKSYCEHNYPISAFDINYAKNVLVTVDATSANAQQQSLVDVRGKALKHRLIVWDLNTMKVTHRFESESGFQSVDINELGTLAVVSLNDFGCTMKVVDLSSGLSVFSTQLLVDRLGDRVNDVRFAGTSTIIAVAFEQQGVHFFIDEHTGVMGKQNMRLFERRDALYGSAQSSLSSIGATSICRLDKVDAIAVGTTSGHVLIWRGRNLAQVIEAHRARVTSLDFDGVSKTLISGCVQGGVRLYDIFDSESSSLNGKKTLVPKACSAVAVREVRLSAQFDILRHAELCGHSISSVVLSRGAHKAAVVTMTSELVEVRCKIVQPSAEELAEAAETAGSAEGEEGAVPASKGQLGDDVHSGPVVAGHFLPSTNADAVSSVAKLLTGSGFVTAGSDRTVRVWQAVGEGDAVTGFKSSKVIKMDSPCTAVAVSNASLAVALFGGDNLARNGSIHLFSLPEGTFIIELPTTSNLFVKDMKMSAEGNLLVVLREDSSLEVFAQTEGQWALRGTIKESDNNVLHSYDLSSDYLFIKAFFSTTQEIKVYDINAGESFGKELFAQIPAPSAVVVNAEDGEDAGPVAGAAQLEQLRALQWATQTCPHNWDSIGASVLKEESSSQIFDRFNHLLLSSCDDGCIEVSRLPCLKASAKTLVRRFSAHAGALSALLFFDEGSARVLSVGRVDGIARVWKVVYDADEFEPDPVDAVAEEAEEEKPEEEDEDGEGKAALPVLYDSGDEEDLEDGIDLRKHILRNARRVENVNIAPSDGVEVVNKCAAEKALTNFASAIDVVEGPFKLTQSCAEALNVSETSLTPSDDLAVDWIYGSTVRQTRNSVRYTNRGEILYPAGALAVMFNKVSKQQRYSFPHRDEITALDLHLSRGLVASSHKGVGEIEIFIWKSADGSVLHSLNCGVHGAVSAIKFSPCGNYLAAAVQNHEHSVLLFSVNEGLLLAHTAGSHHKILNLTFSEEVYTPTTALTLRILQSGVKHFKLLTFNTVTRTLHSKTGIFGLEGKKPNALCSLALPLIVSAGESEGDGDSDPSVTGPEFLIGFADGSIGTIQRGESRISGFTPVMKGPVTAITLAKSTISLPKTSGESEEGALPFKVVAGGIGGVVKILDPELQQLSEYNLYINDFGLYPTGRVRGFKSLAVDKLARKLLFATSAGEIGEIDLTTGQDLNNHHPIVNSHFKAQLRALATHPLRQECLTAGEDKTLRVWNLETHTMTSIIEVPGPAVAATFAPNGHLIVAALSRKHSDPFGGRLTVLSYLQKETRIVYTASDAKEEIRAVIFSPDGSKVYAASLDMCIYVYDALNNFKLVHTLQGHNEGVQSLDISQDGKYLVSESVTQQIMLWELRGHSAITRASEVREILSEIETRYAVRQNLLGLNSIGVFPEMHVVGTREDERESLSVLTLAQSKDASLLATGDSHGLLNLYRNPAVSLAAPHKRFVAHTPGGLSKTAFTVDDRFLLSVGAQDKLLIQWTVKKSGSGPDVDSNITSMKSADTPDATFLESFTVRGVDFSANQSAESLQPLKESACASLQHLVGSNSASSASLAVQFCGQGELLLSTGKTIFSAENAASWQGRKLRLWNASPFACAQSVVSRSAADVSALSVTSCGRFVLVGFTSTAAAGSSPLVIFGAPTGEYLCQLIDNVTGGVRTASFSKDGSLCAVLSGDAQHSLYVFQSFSRSWTTDVRLLQICSVSVQSTSLLQFVDSLSLQAPAPLAATQSVPAAKDLAVSRPVSAIAQEKIASHLNAKKNELVAQSSSKVNYHFATAGEGRIKFWRVDGSNVYFDNAVYCEESQCECSEDPHASTALASVGTQIVSGDHQGNVYLWKSKYRVRTIDEMGSPVTAMCSFGQSLSTSHSENAHMSAGFVVAAQQSIAVWEADVAALSDSDDISLSCISKIDLFASLASLGWSSYMFANNSSSEISLPQVRGMSTDFSAKEILLSLSDGQCLGVSVDSSKTRRVTQSAGNRVLQMAAHPELQHIVVTVGEDAVLRVWDLSGESVTSPVRETASQRPQFASTMVGFLSLPHTATAITFLHAELLLVAVTGADSDGVSGSVLTVEIKPSHSQSDGDVSSSTSPFFLSVVHRFHNVGHGALRQLRLSANKELLASCSDDGCVYVHKVVLNGEGSVLEPVGHLLAHVDASPAIAADFSLDSRYVRVFGENHLMNQTQQRVEVNFFDFQLDGGASAASMNPLKKFAAGKIQDVGMLSALQRVQWGSVSSPAAPEVRGLTQSADDKAALMRTDSIAVSADGRFVAASYEDGLVRVFRHPVPVASTESACLTLAVHSRGGAHIAFQSTADQSRLSLVTLGRVDNVFAVHSLDL